MTDSAAFLPADDLPLRGIKVLELSHMIMGPAGGLVLADLGAEVIKVESPEGDSSRYGNNARNRGMSGGFQHNARGKRSIAAIGMKRGSPVERCSSIGIAEAAWIRSS